MAEKITEVQARSIFKFFILFMPQCDSNMQSNGQKHQLKLMRAVIQKLNISEVTLTVRVVQIQNKEQQTGEDRAPLRMVDCVRRLTPRRGRVRRLSTPFLTLSTQLHKSTDRSSPRHTLGRLTGGTGQHDSTMCATAPRALIPARWPGPGTHVPGHRGEAATGAFHIQAPR